MCLSLLSYLLVRRNILRLYFILTVNNWICLLLMTKVAAACGDAKSCVSRGKSHTMPGNILT